MRVWTAVVLEELTVTGSMLALSGTAARHGDGAGKTIEENSDIFSLT